MPNDLKSETDSSKGYWRISFLIRFIIMGLRSALPIYFSILAHRRFITHYTMD